MLQLHLQQTLQNLKQFTLQGCPTGAINLESSLWYLLIRPQIKRCQRICLQEHFQASKTLKSPILVVQKSNFHEKTKLVPLDSPSFVDAAIVSRNSFLFSSLQVQPMTHIQIHLKCLKRASYFSLQVSHVIYWARSHWMRI